MNPILLIPITISFVLVVLIMPFWIRKAQQIGLVWNDMNKLNKRKVAGSGGIVVLLAFMISSLIYVAYITFYDESPNVTYILAILLALIFAGGIGLIDDLFGWQRGGLSKRSRLILVLLSSIPLIAIKAGDSTINLPLLENVNLGLLYPVLFVPIGIIGATTTFNFLAGMNGLEAGNGIILLSGTALLAYFTGSKWLAVVLLCMIVALIAFLKFNFYPAKVFPGDVLTYPVGSLIACAAIVGNFEKIALFFFIPVIIEVILKSRGKLAKQSFGKPNENEELDMPYNKIYGLTHLSIYLLKKAGIRSTEKNAVYLIWVFQALIIGLGFIIFREGIFYA